MEIPSDALATGGVAGGSLAVVLVLARTLEVAVRGLSSKRKNNNPTTPNGKLLQNINDNIIRQTDSINNLVDRFKEFECPLAGKK